MKKISILLCFICCPVCVFCQDERYMHIQMLRAQIERLQKSRDEKYNELNECSKSAQKFKIAAISTVSAASIGIAVNIALKKKLDALDKAMTGNGKTSDTRSEQQKCIDEMNMYCNAGGADYDEEICQLYKEEGCE